MQDLPRGGIYFFGGEGACDALRSHAFARGFGGMLPRKIFGNGAFWSIFSYFFYFQKVCTQSTDNIY